MSNYDNQKRPSYLFFDIEGYPDVDLILESNEGYDNIPRDAVCAKYREDQRKKAEQLRQRNKNYLEKEDWKESAYFPVTFQRPLFIAVAKIASDYTFLDASVLSTIDLFPDNPIQGSHLVCKKFLDGWRYYGGPTLVTFHGNAFDFPLLKFSAFNYGIDVHDFPFDEKMTRKAESPKHIDMYSVLSNYGAASFRNGRPILTGILGKSGTGKLDYPELVEKLYKEYNFQAYQNICLKRILDYYPIFLRLIKLTGGFGTIPPEKFNEELCKASMKHWIQKQIDDTPTQGKNLTGYLEQWEKYFK